MSDFKENQAVLVVVLILLSALPWLCNCEIVTSRFANDCIRRFFLAVSRSFKFDIRLFNCVVLDCSESVARKMEPDWASVKIFRTLLRL